MKTEPKKTGPKKKLTIVVKTGVRAGAIRRRRM